MSNEFEKRYDAIMAKIKREERMGIEQLLTPIEDVRLTKTIRRRLRVEHLERSFDDSPYSWWNTMLRIRHIRGGW